MNTLQEYHFKRRRNKRKPQGNPVCQVIVCCRRTGKVQRKLFDSWDRARTYVNEREYGRKYHATIERI